MMAISLALVGALIVDQVSKRLLRSAMGPAVIALGPFGRIQIVEGRLWLRRLNRAPNDWMGWALWVAMAIALVIVSKWFIPSAAIFVGLLLGGSASNAIEQSQRGSISDYVCLRYWPAFNLADAAVATGAVGILVELTFFMTRTGI
jgi:lipoprotein signal peptidase